MKITINEYYKVEIDKAIEFFVKEDYTLKSTYFFIGVNILGILYEAILLTKTLSVITFIVYATPLIFGAFLE